jgi:hypothetical protein
MNRTILYRVTLPAGSIQLSMPNKTTKKAARLLSSWLRQALLHGGPMRLPLPATAGFDAAAEEIHGGLLVTLRNRRGKNGPTAIATIAVAAEKAAGEKLWRHALSRARATNLLPPGFRGICFGRKRRPNSSRRPETG